MSTQTVSGMQVALRSPGVKFFVIGVIGFFLLIPASMVWILVTERQDRATEAQADVAQSWGSAQTLGGVFISVPYETQQEMHSAKGVVVQQVRKTAVFLPEEINYKVGSRSSERKRGIFTVPVYDATVEVSGRFKRPAARRHRQSGRC